MGNDGESEPAPNSRRRLTGTCDGTAGKCEEVVVDALIADLKRICGNFGARYDTMTSPITTVSGLVATLEFTTDTIGTKVSSAGEIGADSVLSCEEVDDNKYYHSMITNAVTIVEDFDETAAGIEGAKTRIFNMIVEDFIGLTEKLKAAVEAHQSTATA